MFKVNEIKKLAEKHNLLYKRYSNLNLFSILIKRLCRNKDTNEIYYIYTDILFADILKKDCKIHSLEFVDLDNNCISEYKKELKTIKDIEEFFIKEINDFNENDKRIRLNYKKQIIDEKMKKLDADFE